MNALQDTLGTLNTPVKELVEMVMSTSREIFESGKQVDPALFFIKPDDGSMVVVEVPNYMMSDEKKPELWDTVRKLRRKVPTVAFISEVWESRPKKGDGIVGEDEKVKVMPRDDPNRTECVMLNLWEGIRIITFKAAITRNPDKLGGWEACWDSFFPSKNMTFVGGAMMDGEPCALEGN